MRKSSLTKVASRHGSDQLNDDSDAQSDFNVVERGALINVRRMQQAAPQVRAMLRKRDGEFAGHLQNEVCASASLDKSISRGQVRSDSAGQDTTGSWI